VATQKIIVSKVVGYGKMHTPIKNGVKIQKISLKLAQTMVTI
jgi:hypothetical protein